MDPTVAGSTQLLEQLQNEVNRVLEQMGRIFTAGNGESKTAPAVQATKLKQMMPQSIDSFHGALDQLEHELQLAKLVMRRDLALCRERSGLVKPTHINDLVASSDIEMHQKSPIADAGLSNDTSARATADASTEEVQPSQEAEPTEPNANEKPGDLENADSNLEDQKKAVTTQPDAAQIDQKTSDLQIDTKPQPKKENGETNQGDDDNPPDTGTFSNPNDLDSLFGGPTSAGPGEGAGFTNDEFDFASFGVDNNGADNDNISSLLPGLQDYANTTSDVQASDFDKNVFNLDDMPNLEGQQDNTFDDLLDFEDFTGGDFGAGSDVNTANATGNTDFDFSFD